MMYNERLRNTRCLPQTKIQLIKVLEEELNLTSCCLCSYIDFKRESLQLIQTYNYGNVPEEENLET